MAWLSVWANGIFNAGGFRILKRKTELAAISNLTLFAPCLFQSDVRYCFYCLAALQGRYEAYECIVRGELLYLLVKLCSCLPVHLLFYSWFTIADRCFYWGM